VNPTLIGALWRQRLASWFRMLLLTMVMGMPLVTMFFTSGGGLAQLGNCYGAVLVLAAGMIGQDLSSGTLQLLLARPVTRTEYVLSRWGAAACGTILLVLLQLGLALLIMASHGSSPPLRDTLVFLGDNVALAIGLAAVIALFSTLAPGLGDLGLMAIGFFMSFVLQGLGTVKQWPAALRASAEIQQILSPELNVAGLGQTPFPWLSVVAYLSTVTLCLALAIVVLNRKELSYASSSG
jgi:ABC-type Na+ efflux pump permease subunit